MFDYYFEIRNEFLKIANLGKNTRDRVFFIRKSQQLEDQFDIKGNRNFKISLRMM